MRDILKVTRWELSTGIKNKTFLIMTFLIPIIMIIIGLVSGYFATRDGQQELTIGVIDKTGNIYDPLQQSIYDSNINLKKYSQSIEENLKDIVDREELDGLLIIPADIYETNNLIYYYKDLQGRGISIIRNAIDPLIIDKRLEDRGYSPAEIRSLTQSVRFDERSLKKLDEDKGAGISSQIELYFPLGLAMMMAMSSMFSGTVLMQSIIKEKSDRIVEIILSSISARSLMIGKMIGYGILGLIQISIWLISALMVANIFFDISLEPLVSIDTIYMFIYFILGFILVASLNAMVGSATKDVQSGSQSSGLVVIISIIPVYFSGAILSNPSGIISRLLSYIPFTTATTMLIRTAFSSPPTWEYILTYGILILATAFFPIIALKVFRVGMLMYGKNLSFKEVIKWARSNSY